MKSLVGESEMLHIRSKKEGGKRREELDTESLSGYLQDLLTSDEKWAVISLGLIL